MHDHENNASLLSNDWCLMHEEGLAVSVSLMEKRQDQCF